MQFVAPRILNEPETWKHSSFSLMRGPPGGESSANIGVRRTRPRRRAAALSTSLRESPEPTSVLMRLRGVVEGMAVVDTGSMHASVQTGVRRLERRAQLAEPGCLGARRDRVD